MSFEFDSYFRSRPVIVAPMEDVSDAIFRRVVRARGASLCLTEFINVEGLLRGCKHARRKVTLLDGDHPTAIQIYGSNPERLEEAARFAEQAQPVYLDINCGCWVPKIAGRGAGAGWLRDPEAMVAMAARVVKAIALPVTVKTRIGYGPESHMPIVDLARRLEDAGVRALTIHCRTAQMGYTGKADWSWARRAREVVTIPVIVNGDIATPDDARRALEETGCAGVMIGRGAIAHPWIIGEVRGLLDHDQQPTPIGWRERLALCHEHLAGNIEQRGQGHGIRYMRRYYPGYLRGLHCAAQVRKELNDANTLPEVVAIFDALAEALERRERVAA